MTTLLTDHAELTLPKARAADEDLWIDAGDLEAATGWTLKPEGFCQGDVCVPIPPKQRAELLDDAAVNTAAFWRHLGHPVVHDEARSTWVFGTRAADRASSLAALEAPDFALPDINGHMHSLSEHRGKKVFLVTWASW